MLGTIVQWSVIIFLASRLNISYECASTALGTKPQLQDPQKTSVLPTKAADSTVILQAPNTTCGLCPNLPTRQSDNSSKPVQQSFGTGSDGCSTLTVFCAGESPDTATILTWYDGKGIDAGSTFGSGTVTAVLQCNLQNKLVLMNSTVNEVECISG